MATCHPDKPHRGRGMCGACLVRDNRARRLRILKAAPGRPSGRVPDCHPDRPHKAKGLCENCYKRRETEAKVIGLNVKRLPLPETSVCPKCGHGLVPRYALFDRGRVLEIYCPRCGSSWTIWGQEGMATHTVGFLSR